MLACTVALTTPFSEWRQGKFLKVEAVYPPLRCNGLLCGVLVSRFQLFRKRQQDTRNVACVVRG